MQKRNQTERNKWRDITKIWCMSKCKHLFCFKFLLVVIYLRIFFANAEAYTKATKFCGEQQPKSDAIPCILRLPRPHQHFNIMLQTLPVS